MVLRLIISHGSMIPGLSNDIENRSALMPDPEVGRHMRPEFWTGSVRLNSHKKESTNNHRPG